MCLWCKMEKPKKNEQNVCPSLDVSVHLSICPQSLLNGLYQVSVKMPELNPQINTVITHVTEKLCTFDEELIKL